MLSFKIRVLLQKTEHCVIQNALLCHYLQQSQTFKNCPVLFQAHPVIIIIVIIRIYLNRPELILSRGCGLAAQSWSHVQLSGTVCQPPCEAANHNSLPLDVRSTSEGSPVRLIDSAPDDYLGRALQIYSSSFDISLKIRFFGLHFTRRMYRCIFNHFCVIRPKSYRIRRNYAN